MSDAGMRDVGRSEAGASRGPGVAPPMLDARWPADRGQATRVAVECDDPATTAAAVAVLQAAGHEVAVCAGPDAHHRCPLLEQDRCPLVEGSDVVVNLLGFGGERRHRVLPHLRRRYPTTPIAAEASTAQRFTYRDLLTSVFTIDAPARPESLTESVAVAACCAEPSRMFDSAP